MAMECRVVRITFRVRVLPAETERQDNRVSDATVRENYGSGIHASQAFVPWMTGSYFLLINGLGSEGLEHSTINLIISILASRHGADVVRNFIFCAQFYKWNMHVSFVIYHFANF